MAGSYAAPNLPGMLLAVDIGNTQTHVGLFEAGEELSDSWRLATNATTTSDEIGIKLVDMLTAGGYDPTAADGVIVSTRRPAARRRL